MTKNLTKCSKCLLPETHETITFNDNGTCNICIQQEYKKEVIDWSKKKIELNKLIEEHRGKYDYDCIVPFSGGKDSTWTLYYLVKEYKIKPLVVRFDHGFMRNQLEKNNKETFSKLGVDVITFTPNWKIVKKLMLQSLLEKGDFCWHCHTGIFSYPMWVALNYKVPLIFWGEPSADYTAYYSYEQEEKVDEKRFNRYVNLGINAEDMFIRLGGTIDKRDLKPYSYPPLKDLRNLKYNSVCLGSYIEWDVPKQYDIISKELDWKGDEVENVPSQYSYEKIECHLQGVRDYIKFIKRGYSRPTHLSSLDIRGNKISREEGIKICKEFEGKRPPSLDIFLEYLNITEEEFLEIVLTHQISPHKHNHSLVKNGKKTHDFETWFREVGMTKEQSNLQINSWKKRNTNR